MKIDVITLTKTTNDAMFGMTERMIKSLRQSEGDIEFNVIQVEGGWMDYMFDCNKKIAAPEPFNYNKAINSCYSLLSDANWLVISNNDVRFERGWMSEIIRLNKLRPDIESFSPKCPYLYNTYYKDHFLDTNADYLESFKVTEAVQGWCLVMKKNVWEKLYPFDELFDMFYQDNDYAMQLEKHGFKHALARHSIVFHYGSKTINASGVSQQGKMDEDFLKFKQKYNYQILR